MYIYIYIDMYGPRNERRHMFMYVYIYIYVYIDIYICVWRTQRTKKLLIRRTISESLIAVAAEYTVAVPLWQCGGRYDGYSCQIIHYGFAVVGNQKMGYSFWLHACINAIMDVSMHAWIYACTCVLM